MFKISKAAALCGNVFTKQIKHFSTSKTLLDNIGVIGAGQIGTCVTLGLLKTGHKVKVTDPSTENAEFLKKNGAEWVNTATEACDGVDVLVTAVPAPPHVRQVMEEEGVLYKLKKDTCWIDHTTTDKQETIRLSKIAESQGVKMLEAPLTGGYELLKAGLMTVLVGGDKEVLKTYEPLIRSYTETVIRVGDIGAASVVKVISNMLAGAHLVVAAESLMMAKKHNVDLKAFFDGIRASAGNSYVFETEVPLMFNGTFDPGFAIELHNKDYNLGRLLAQEAEVPLEAMGLCEQIYLRAMYKYGKKVGSSMPAKLIQDDLNESMQIDGYKDWTYKIEKVSGGGIGVVHKFDKKNLKD